MSPKRLVGNGRLRRCRGYRLAVALIVIAPFMASCASRASTGSITDHRVPCISLDNSDNSPCPKPLAQLIAVVSPPETDLDLGDLADRLTTELISRSSPPVTGEWVQIDYKEQELIVDWLSSRPSSAEIISAQTVMRNLPGVVRVERTI